MLSYAFAHNYHVIEMIPRRPNNKQNKIYLKYMLLRFLFIQFLLPHIIFKIHFFRELT
jgi:hypothetical protein